MQDLIKAYLEAKAAADAADARKKELAKRLGAELGVEIGKLDKAAAEDFKKIVKETEAGKVTVYSTVRKSYPASKVEKYLSPQQKVAARSFACFTSVKVSRK